MSALGTLINQKLRASEKQQAPQTLLLHNGLVLKVSGHTDPAILHLSRVDMEPSELEGHTCAKHAGWAAYDLQWQAGPFRTLLVKKGQALL